MKWTNSYRSFGLKTKRSTGLKTIEHKHAQATLAAGFDNAMLAASDSIGLRPEAGPAETDLVSLALRHRDGEPDGTDAQGPDLLDYDRCINGDGPDDGEEGR